MAKLFLAGRWGALGVLLAVCMAGAGCQSIRPDRMHCGSPIPRELAKVTFPTYVVEPPDILLIDALRVIPKPPYHAQPLDVLIIRVTGVLEAEPIAGPYQIAPDGTVALGLSYGSVRLAGLSLEEAKAAIETHLKLKKFVKPEAEVTLGQSRTLQQIRGEHLVRPDGTLFLGTYGSVHVAGLTLAEVRAAIEGHLSEFILDPEVSVDVAAYNSKVIYVIVDGAGSGQSVYRLAATGNETVLDIMSQVGGVTPVTSRHRIWIARPGPTCNDCDQILPVDWDAITMRTRSETNYQLLPGDRLYVDSQSLITVNGMLSKVFAPIQSITGTALLGRGVVGAFSGPLTGSGSSSNSGNAIFPKGREVGGGRVIL